jgi:hypothetical protein
MATPSTPQAKGRTESAEKSSQPLRSPEPAAESFASPLLGLQRAAGNQAVSNLLGGILQPKLRIGPPGDVYEREADRVADAVLREGGAPFSGEGLVQRQCHCQDEELAQRKCPCQEEENLVQPKSDGRPAQSTPEFAGRVGAMRGSGRPLPADVRSFFEPRFGHDFGAVRVHAGSAADEAARAVHARAFTVGNDVAFAAGEWSPETAAGKRLLAHELTHVVQQTPLVARRQPLLQREPDESAESAPRGGTEPAATPEGEAPAPQGPAASPKDETPAPEAPASEPPAAEGEPAPALVVDDEAATVGPGQMKKSEFFTRLRAASQAAAEEALAGTEHAGRAGPLIDQWLGSYAEQDTARINRDLLRFAGEGPRPTTAEEYISLIAERVRASVATWAKTGEVTGVPQGLSPADMELPGMGSLGGGLLGGLGSVFFKAKAGGARGPDHPAALQARLGAGRPLEGSIRSRMESAFGRSFSQVRVHTDGAAAGLSAGFNARAFTVGRHVAFGPQEYRPGTMIGDALIAHELAHVAQQGDAAAAGPVRAEGAAYRSLERDADLATVGAVAAMWTGLRGRLRSFPRLEPRLSSGLRLQRCERCSLCSSPQATTAGPQGQATASPAAPGQPATEAPTPPAAEPVQLCATASDHAGIIALRAKDGLPPPKGTLVYGFTLWQPKTSATKPKLEIDWTKAGNSWTGTVKPTTTAMGTIEALFLEEGDHQVPGKTVQAKFPQCGAGGKSVPFVSHLSKDLSLLSQQAEQEHCNDYRRAFNLTYQKWADNINSLTGRTFGPGTKDQVKTQIDTALRSTGDKGRNGWVAELDRLNALSTSARDDTGRHSLKPDGAPVTADAACSVLKGITVKSARTEVPGPASEDIVK